MNAIVNRLVGKCIAVPEVLAVEIARLESVNAELLAALEYALKNITEVAIPQADALGRVTSLPDCAAKLRAAIAKARGE